MSAGSLFVRSAIGLACAAACATASARASAQSAAASPDVVIEPSTVAFARAWPRPIFVRRSNGLMVTAVVFASTAATVVASGGIVYGTATDSCLDLHHQNSDNKGHFCYAQRSQFDAGMGMMVVGGAVFAIAVPVAVWAGSGARHDPRADVSLKLGARSVVIAGSF